MKLPGRGTLAANGLSLAVLLFLYVGDLLDWSRARAAEVSALRELPNVGFAAAVLLAAAAVVVVVLHGIARARESGYRGYRLLPIVAVVALFVDLFVLSVDSVPVSPADQLTIALDSFARAASERSSPERVLSSTSELQELARGLGTPPYLVRGAKAGGYSVQRRDGCDGPVAHAPGAAVGTLLYCVSRDQRQAWVTVVALPYDRRFGAPEVLSRDGYPLAVPVGAAPPEAPEEAPAEAPTEGEVPLPTEGAEALDGG